MGALEVTVKLTNAVDEELVKRGVLNPALLRTCEVTALVDTGSVRTVLPAKLIEQLGLSIRAKQMAQYADGREELVGVTGPVIIDIQGRETIESALMTGNTVLMRLYRILCKRSKIPITQETASLLRQHQRGWTRQSASGLWGVGHQPRGQ